MKRVYSLTIMISATLLTGCVATTSPPVISDFNGDSVKLVTPMMAENLRKANEICGTRNRSAQYASTTTIESDIAFGEKAEHLYLCI
ncbi:hypothetical protein [Halocynthiibacter styelae]|uniref:Uncharacterized protein n=1 Tax=Halocynthiibacter styelae TaxID=2761955 RepID=A0A8J7LPT4_9RHOB|nr:hypothetical protein [Paenihalocynthiibacter styelae]MBI1494081.1 hypothetical protein [Paenihalocynthiibacter styelae]